MSYAVRLHRRNFLGELFGDFVLQFFAYEKLGYEIVVRVIFSDFFVKRPFEFVEIFNF